GGESPPARARRSAVPSYHQLIRMHQHRQLRQLLRQLLPLPPGDHRRIPGAAPREPTRDLPPVAVHHAYGVPRAEISPHAAHAPRRRRPPTETALWPCARPAPAAPRSSTMSPRGRSVNAIQYFFALIRSRAATNSVPTSSPASTASSVLGSRASATTTFAPAS